MYQLNAVPGRTFAALRLDQGVAELDDFENEGISLTSSSKSALSGGGESPLFRILTDLFAPLPLLQRWKVAQVIGERWKVPMPSKKRTDKAEMCQEVVGVLAAKLGNVIARKSGLSNAGRDGGIESLTHYLHSGRGSDHPRVSVRMSSVLSAERPSGVYDYMVSGGSSFKESTTVEVFAPPGLLKK
ncbi:putative receptor-type adenylate cyclase GRESAG 4 [Trypanosoma grayi]|uniref:putative receptor-type adenylate cyclase GRESAG 4 n=1 Tax=Trypanosoma grayi TaxID=71804 RepID=UPI0004F46638|nr:putative receptor-type adenylate cyclase GRESAG 4 [Trypanosoma grayi]KEG05329.1 putative receptor-type adenylate cyclase GRESAG 4 [Trypanosoma grayi]